MFFVISKIFWMLAIPLNALCFLGLIGFTVRIWCQKAGNRILMAVVAALLVFGVLPIGPFMVAWLESRYDAPQTLPEKVDGIIVLGGATESHIGQARGQLSVNESAERLFAFNDLARKYPDAIKIFTGGSGDIYHQDTKESDDARRLVKSLGLPDKNILYEDKSRNTYENALYSKELAKPQAGQTWILVTSAWHMPRSVGIFTGQGWDVIPYPCDFRTDGHYGFLKELPNVTFNFRMLDIAVKELIGAVVYYATGKSAFILPIRTVPLQDE